MSTKTRISITISDELPGPGGYYAHYEHRVVHSKAQQSVWNKCDLLAIARERQKAWLADIERWHAEICRQASVVHPYWWNLKGSRLVLWHPPILNPFLFCIAALEYCKIHNLKSLTLVGCPSEVVEILSELSADHDLIVLNKLKVARQFLGNLDRNFFSVVRFWLKEFLGILKPKKTIETSKFETCVLSFLMDSTSNTSRPDHYFGTMFDERSKTHSEKIAWAYYVPRFSEAFTKESLAIMRGAGKQCVVIQDYLTAFDMFKIIFDLLRTAWFNRSVRRYFGPMTIDGYRSQVASDIFFKTMVEKFLPIEERILFHALKRMLTQMSSLKRLIYPYEERSVDRVVIEARDCVRKCIEVVGYAHTVHHQLNIYFNVQKQREANPPRPDRIAVAGPAEKKWLTEYFRVPSNKVFVLGSGRYLKPSVVSKNALGGRKLKVLFVVTYRHELTMLSIFIDARHDLFSDCEVLIRPYPFGWQKEQAEDIEAMKKTAPIQADSSNTLEKQIDWADLVLYSSSSVGFTAVCYGCIAALTDLHGLIYVDPSKEVQSEGVFRCKTADELKALIDRLRMLSPEQYSQVVKVQQKFVQEMMAAPIQEVVDDTLGVSRIIS